MCCGIGGRRSSDPALLWLWCRQAAAAPIGPLAREPPYATGEALKKEKKKESQPSFEQIFELFALIDPRL